jgi:hypothetical protein
MSFIEKGKDVCMSVEFYSIQLRGFFFHFTKKMIESGIYVQQSIIGDNVSVEVCHMNHIEDIVLDVVEYTVFSDSKTNETIGRSYELVSTIIGDFESSTYNDFIENVKKKTIIEYSSSSQFNQEYVDEAVNGALTLLKLMKSFLKLVSQ